MSTAETSARRYRGADLRRAYDLALAGAIGAVMGLFLFTELVHTGSIELRDALAGAAIGAALGFVLNAAEPLRDGAWLKLCRSASWGAIAGAAGGAIGLLVGEWVLVRFEGGLAGRAVSWAILGLGIGLSQGLASRSAQRLRFGLIGGGLGGALGGFLFEWLRVRIGSQDEGSVRLGQGLGMIALGAGLGLCLALVEQALRRAWVQVVRGRQEGRAYLLARRRNALGLDERAEVGLFGDPTVARRHAEIEQTPRGYVLRNLDPKGRTKVNGSAIAAPHALRDGDRIELGGTLLVFRQR